MCDVYAVGLVAVEAALHAEVRAGEKRQDLKPPLHLPVGRLSSAGPSDAGTVGCIARGVT